jgi:voltage-gated potassium channel
MKGIQRKRAFEILERATVGDRTSLVVDVFILLLIVLNVVAVILESVLSIENSLRNFFYSFEVVSVAIFTIEYVLRVWCCVEDERYKSRVGGRLRFMFSFYALVDLLAILPFYIPFLLPLDMRFVRAMRLLRLGRILKVTRYSSSARLIGQALHDSKRTLVVAVGGIAVLLIVASSVLYFIEHDVQPDVFSSIPAAMWWGMATLTTVGYGDVTPITTWGKVIALLVSILGIGAIALPTAILGGAFAECLGFGNKVKHKCPNCGTEF